MGKYGDDINLFESPSSDKIKNGCNHVKLDSVQLYVRCPICGPASPSFAMQKGLDAHLRAKHKQRNVLSNYIDSSGVCPVCKVNFHTRVHVLRHVADKRCRAKVKYRTCHDRLVSGEFPLIDQHQLDRAFLIDSSLRSEARKRGRTQVLVQEPAKRRRWANQFASGGLSLADDQSAPSRKRLKSQH